jgi:hypothetical protein
MQTYDRLSPTEGRFVDWAAADCFDGKVDDRPSCWWWFNEDWVTPCCTEWVRFIWFYKGRILSCQIIHFDHTSSDYHWSITLMVLLCSWQCPVQRSCWSRGWDAVGRIGRISQQRSCWVQGEHSTRVRWFDYRRGWDRRCGLSSDGGNTVVRKEILIIRALKVRWS